MPNCSSQKCHLLPGRDPSQSLEIGGEFPRPDFESLEIGGTGAVPRIGAQCAAMAGEEARQCGVPSGKQAPQHHPSGVSTRGVAVLMNKLATATALA